jgi:hypothetical protein
MRVTCDGRTKNTAEMHSACSVKLQQNKADLKGKTKTLAVQHTWYARPMSSIEATFELHCTCSISPWVRNPQLQEMTGGTCTRWAEYQTMLIPMKTRTQSCFCERDGQASRRSECQTIEPATKQSEVTEYNQVPMTFNYERKNNLVVVVETFPNSDTYCSSKTLQRNSWRLHPFNIIFAQRRNHIR